MRITSPVFENGEKIPDTYTCDGEGHNPPLLFLEIPRDAKSLVLIMDDPDASSNDFVHWIVYDISLQEKEVVEDASPMGGLLGLNSAGKLGYTPPCPPSGEHRYIFKLYAIDIRSLDVKKSPKKEDVLKAMEGHILDQAEITGLYSRE